MQAQRLIALILALAVCGTPMVSQAQTTWDDFIEGIDPNLQFGSGRIQGGMTFAPPYRDDRAILRGGIRTGGICGFDFSLNLRTQFEQLLDSVPELLMALALGTAFSIACQSFPVQCDIFKHLHQYINYLLRMQRASCQQAMALGKIGGAAMSSPAIADCIKAELAASGNIDAAMESCLDGTDTIPGPNGLRAPEINLVEDVLETSGLSAVVPDVAEMIASRLVNLTFTTSGTVFTQTGETPPDASLDRIEEHQFELVDEINIAVDTVLTGGIPDPIGIPGEPIPIAALHEIGSKSPAERQHEVVKLAGNIAFAKEIWTLLQAAHHWDKAVQVSDLPEDQREKAERMYESLLKESRRLREMKETVEANLTPQIEALLEDRARHEAWAAQVMQQATSDGPAPVYLQETGQDFMGYQQ